MKELEYPFDSSFLLKNRRKIRRALLADGTLRMEKRIAILGGSTTNDIASMLELFLLQEALPPSFTSRSTPSTGRTPCSTIRNCWNFTPT